jgi:hypothetical protein
LEGKYHTGICLKPDVIEQEVAEVYFVGGLSNWEIGKGKLVILLYTLRLSANSRKPSPFTEPFNVTTQSLNGFKL